MSNPELLESIGINLKGKFSGQIKTLCPECSETRKNKRDLCLSVNIDDGVYSCHNCDFKGRVWQKNTKVYEKPVARLTKLNSKALQYFEGTRKISNNTLLSLDVISTEEFMPSLERITDVICFNYYRDGVLINQKYRGPGKTFKMSSGAELIFYNLDKIKNETECVIVEGEIDCLTLHECGIYNVVSVPNGASKGSMKLEYLDNCWEYFAGMKKIVLMTDGDEPGYLLREELARRLGKEICFKVTYPEGCKDANDILIKYGKENVIKAVTSAIQWPIEGIIDVEAIEEEIVHFYEHGYPVGERIGVAEFDKLISFMPGQLTTVTGIPGSGKSEFVDWIMCRLSERSGWDWAVCSFENQPSSIHVSKLMEKFTGKSFAHRLNEIHRMTAIEAHEAIEKIKQSFHFINISEIDLSLTGILSKAKELVIRKGIKGLIIDPWNYIEHKIPDNYTETQYISECLTTIKNFAVKNEVHVFLIAHPTKIAKDIAGKYLIPTLYSISGSAHFFNKTDNGICVYRDFETNVVTVYVQKIRFAWLGEIGSCSFNYDTFTRQYRAIA